MVLPFSDMSKDDLEKVEQIKQIATAITGEIFVDVPNNTISLRLLVPADNPRAREVASNLMTQFPQQLSTQLNMFFGIKGIIRRKSK